MEDKLKNTFSTYLVHEGNNALLPGKALDYSTIVLSTFEKIYVKSPPLKIIEESCYRDYASYDGRRKAVRYMTGYSNKLPIPVNTARKIYAFPTKSPANPDCIWIFFNRIKKLEDKTHDSDSTNRSVVHFIDGTSLPLDVSFYTLEQQYKRTKHCIDLYDCSMEMAFR